MKKQALRLAYLSALDPRNKKLWSGTHFSIYTELQKLGEVIILGPYEPRLHLWICKLINLFSFKILNKRFDYRHSFFISRAYGRYFSKRLKEKRPDLIVAPAASAELAFLSTKIPIIYITDGTFSSCLNYHESLSNLWNFNIRQGNRIEQLALEKSFKTIVPSNWALHSVIQDYGISEQKLLLLPFGANFEKLPQTNELTEHIPEKWKLLFVGVYWKNKGGDIAFNAFKNLHDKGYPVSLTVLGCIPPEEIKHSGLEIIPFIDKNQDDGMERLNKLFKEHHILILPTRFDCSPIVINEASAFGIPSIVSNTGGVAAHLNEGKNGYLIDYADTGEAYAKRIETLILDPPSYLKLRRSTRLEYEQRLNWEHWRKAFAELKPVFPDQTL